jgi:hypothetical protein
MLLRWRQSIASDVWRRPGLPARMGEKGGDATGEHKAFSASRTPRRVFVFGTQGATAPKLHGAHLAVALPFAISRLKMMGGTCGLPYLSRSGKASRGFEPRRWIQSPEC